MLCIYYQTTHRMKSVFKKYFQSVISPDEFEKFSIFINQEKNNEFVWELMKTEWENQQNEIQSISANPTLYQKIQLAILHNESTIANKKLKLYALGLKIAAVLIIGLFLTVSLFFMNRDSDESYISYQTVSIPFGAKTQFHLPDGSLVWLNSGSTLNYSNDFSKHRQVELKGEAFFDVVKNKCPFLVKTTVGEIEVLGTAFNVLAYSDDEFTVTLERGLVNVTDFIQKNKVLIKPGEQIQMAQNILVKNTVNTELFTSWKDGKLIFSREPFPSLIKRLERWFNVEIEHTSSTFDGLWFSGTIEGETLTEVMDMICKAAPVEYSYNSKIRKINLKQIEKQNK